VTGDGLRTFLQTIVGNIFLVGMGAGALVFLFRREFVRFAEFAVIVVLVASFVFIFEMWVKLSGALADAFGR
jgi:uncharacterized membrane protein